MAGSESRALTAFAAVDAPGTEVVFERLAVTEQQIADYDTLAALVRHPDVLSGTCPSVASCSAGVDRRKDL
jgi:hypothetical protein